MSRLIDADALEDKARQYSLGYYEEDEWAVPFKEITSAPTIDAVEVVRGEWVYCEDYVGQDGYKCSECGFFAPWHYNVYDIDYISNYHYCPNCGAKMDGERKTND